LNEELIYSTLDLKMKEHQQAQRMRALQHFVSDFEGGGKTCGDMSSDAKHFIMF